MVRVRVRDDENFNFKFFSFLFLKDFKNKIEKLFFYSRKETKIQLESEEKIPFLFYKNRNCSFVRFTSNLVPLAW